MKTCSLATLAFSLIFLGGHSIAWSADNSLPQDKNLLRGQATARRQLEIAQLRLRLYERVEYPNQLRLLEINLKLSQAHEESYKRRLQKYEKFTKFQHSSPLLESIETTKMALLTVQLRSKQLDEEKFLLVHFHSDRRRLLELLVEAAQEQVDVVKSARRLPRVVAGIKSFGSLLP